MVPINPKVLESLNYGISAEIKSYVFYLEAAKIVATDSFRQTMLKLAGEEKGHYQLLERQHHSLITSEQWVSYSDILNRPGLPEINEEMAAVHKGLIAQARQAGGEKELLTIALGLEEDAHQLFSKAAAAAADPEEKKTFEFLARFEMAHIRLIQGMMKSL